jgi:hypothetical protein
MSTKEVTISLRMKERCPIHNACRWEQLWRQRELASPVREGINQIRACRFRRGIPEPTSQETRVPISPTSVGAELLRFAVPPTIERAFDYRRTFASCGSGIWLLVVNLASATAGTTCPWTQIFGLRFFTIQWSPRFCLKPCIPTCTGSSRRELKDRPLGGHLEAGSNLSDMPLPAAG